MMEADVDDICRALTELFTMDSIEREIMGTRGRLLVEEQFQWSRVAQQMTEVYDWVLGWGPQPACVQN